MIYFCMIICEIIFIFWSYLFVKTYQLNGYKISKFLTSCATLKLAYGDKSKLNFTKRLLRFYFVLIILSFLIFFAINYFLQNDFLKVLDCLIVYLFTPIILTLAHYIIYPVEMLIRYYYIKKASRKLKKLSPTVIAITGSYGKTSTKNILKAFLEKKYSVVATPKSYNTEMGLCKTILERYNGEKIFIAEMGARKCKDILSLTRIAKPNIGVITTIGPQHIETFKSLENIENTKFELVQNIVSGFAIFNGDSESSYKLYRRFDGEKFLTCVENSDAYATDIKVSSKGSKFNLYLDGKRYSVSTKLLGKFNIDNIVTAALVAFKLGISATSICKTIPLLAPSPHRLELIENDYCTVLDDAYNSNFNGFSEALNVLSMFEGQKIVITPGLVEMGSMTKEVNFKLGALIADHADALIIMDNINKNALLSGAIAHNFPRERIYFAETRKKQKEILTSIMEKNSVILFENDLSDNYK